MAFLCVGTGLRVLLVAARRMMRVVGRARRARSRWRRGWLQAKTAVAHTLILFSRFGALPDRVAPATNPLIPKTTGSLRPIGVLSAWLRVLGAATAPTGSIRTKQYQSTRPTLCAGPARSALQPICRAAAKAPVWSALPSRGPWRSRATRCWFSKQRKHSVHKLPAEIPRSSMQESTIQPIA